MSNSYEQDQITSVRLIVSGQVQGVGFRKFSQAAAIKLQLSGVVRNLADGRVELQVEGDRKKIETLIAQLQEGFSRSRVDKVDVSWQDTSEGYTAFSITF